VTGVVTASVYACDAAGRDERLNTTGCCLPASRSDPRGCACRPGAGGGSATVRGGGVFGFPAHVFLFLFFAYGSSSRAFYSSLSLFWVSAANKQATHQRFLARSRTIVSIGRVYGVGELAI